MITAVPWQWEKEGILFWPRLLSKAKVEELRTNANSVPNPNWSKIKCQLKTENIPTFFQAEKLEELYLTFNDTEDENMFQENTKEKRLHPVKKNIVKDCANFDSEFDSEIEVESVDSLKAPIPFKLSTVSTSISESNTTNTEKSQESTTIVSVNELPQLYIGDDFLREEFIKYKTTNEKVLAEMNIKLDQLLKLVDNQNKLIEALSQRRDHSDNFPEEDNFNFNNFPLKTIVEMNQFENDLRNSNTKKAHIQRFSRVCGTSGLLKGNKMGLQLIRQLFEDELLLNYAWRGVQGSNKLAFFPLHEIRDFIFEVLHLADSNFSKVCSDQFLQNSALKHCQQRINRKLKQSDDRTKSENKGAGEIHNKDVDGDNDRDGDNDGDDVEIQQLETDA